MSKEAHMKLVSAVSGFLDAKRDGTVILMGEDDGGWGKLIIDNNQLCALSYKNVTGVSALEELERLNEISFLLREAKEKNNGYKTDPAELISTDQFFSFFGVSYEGKGKESPSNGNSEHNQSTNVSKILVVDDSVIARNAAAKPLVKCGFEVTEANDGFDAIFKIKQIEPDLIILDLIMPGMDGYKVIDLIKKNEKFKNVPIIMVTSKSSIMDIVKGKMSPTDAYITKPFDANDLLDTVVKLLKKTA